MGRWRQGAVWVALLGLAAVLGGASEVEWGYQGEVGPAFWGGLDESFALCDVGQTQSPIDVAFGDVGAGALPDFALDYAPTPVVLLNNGHAVEVEVQTGSFLRLDDDLLELLQFHFHAPSEHTLEGRSFAMELHLVHLCGRCFFRNEAGALAVIGVLIEEGEENAAFARFWDALPGRAGSEVDAGVSLDLYEVLPRDRTAYRYAGSLTTPPCSEGVTWLLLKQPITLSAEQIDAFKAVLAGSCCPFNNRPVQPLNGRQIEVVRDRE